MSYRHFFTYIDISHIFKMLYNIKWLRCSKSQETRFKRQDIRNELWVVSCELEKEWSKGRRSKKMKQESRDKEKGRKVEGSKSWKRRSKNQETRVKIQDSRHKSKGLRVEKEEARNKIQETRRRVKKSLDKEVKSKMFPKCIALNFRHSRHSELQVF